MQETKENRFKRIASRRVNKILYDIKVLGNLSNKNHYSYEEDDVNKIFGAIEKDLKTVKALFRNNTTSRKFEL